MSGRVANKVAIVSGGGAGLGLAIVTQLAQQGAKAIVIDIDDENGKETADIAGHGTVFRHQDVTSEDGWIQLFSDIEAEHGGLDILVNNAGIEGVVGPQASPETTTLEEWRKLQTVNLESVFLSCKYAIPLMRKTGGGSIINLSSIAAFVPSPFITAYGASKAAIWQLSRSIADHCARNRDHIRCNTVHPGQIKTPMHDRLIDHLAGVLELPREAVNAEFLSKIPMGEYGEPNDIAYAVLYLASDESKHVTGSQIVVDGGMNNV